ncbi:MAG TPA: hypothetical protein VF808_15405 [Ktedonobacterales bacterium]
MSDNPPLESEPAAVVSRSRLARAERVVTIIAVGLAAIAAVYLLVTLLSEHEVCYGMTASHLLCQQVDVTAAERAALVLMYPGVLFVGAAAGAFWHTRAVEPGARSTAFGLLASCAVVLVGIVVPAVSGAGFFLLPATIAMSVAAILGAVKFGQDFRASRGA